MWSPWALVSVYFILWQCGIGRPKRMSDEEVGHKETQAEASWKYEDYADLFR